MELVCMPGAVCNNYKAFKDYIEVGFSHALLDVSSYCMPEALENREEIYDKWFRGKSNEFFLPKEPEKTLEVLSFFVEECKRNGISNCIARAPFFPWDSKRKDSQKVLYRLTIETIRACVLAGSKYVIIYPQYLDIRSEVEYQKCFEWYASYIEELKKAKITALIPNVPCVSHDGRYKRGFFSDGHELNKLINQLNQKADQEMFGLCLDIGVCQLLGQNVFEFVTLINKRIKAVMFRENDGIYNVSWIPFMTSYNGGGRQDWDAVIRGLREIKFDGPLMLSFGDSDRAVTHLLRKQLLSLEKNMGDYFVWQISMEKVIQKYSNRVLFGAGNMCRNYMKYYGEKYPPLFTCDNNSSLWGSTVCGLVIQNPKSLKELPEECAIFVCNIYYREIEAQLRDMGIRNPIEYFSDEYLPIKQEDSDYV